MDRRTLKRRVLALGQEVECSVKCLNLGGCCVYAALLADALEQAGHKVSGFSSSMWGAHSYNVDELRPNVKENTLMEWNEQGVYFGHVGVEVMGLHIDSTGAFKAYTHPDLDHISGVGFTVKDLKELAQGPGWNGEFKRDQIPTIEAIVSKHLNKWMKSSTLSVSL